MSRRRRPEWFDVIAAGAAPGAIAGIHFAGLIFFLNPGLPFQPAPVLRGMLVYGALFALASLTLLLPLTWGRRRRARRIFPWSLTVVFALSGVLDAAHASYYSFYLPSGINERLLKAALWLVLAALISFYTALLHTLHRRPYGSRSRLAYVLLAGASIYTVLERREAFRPRPEPAPRPSRVESGERPRLYVIGIDSATLDAILPLAQQGRLPFLAGMLQGGTYGRLSSLTPRRRGALWTTLATGKYPFKHGIVGDRTYPASFLAPGARLELLPAGLSFQRWGLFGARAQPVGDDSRRALALWDVLERLGVACGTVGWPATSPPAPGLRFALSDRYFSRPGAKGEAEPGEVAERARLFRVDPEEVDPVLLRHFGARPPPPVLDALAGDLWRQSLTSFLLEQQGDVGAVFLGLPGLEQVSRQTFGGYSAVQFDGVQRARNRQAFELLASHYRQLDDYLGGLWAARQGPRILAVVSAYGVEAPSGWRWLRGALSTERSLEGYTDRSPDGVVLLYGDAIRIGGQLGRVELVDVVPTLLYSLGFPIARDLDGQVLTGAFQTAFLARHPLTFLPSYEALTDAADPSRLP